MGILDYFMGWKEIKEKDLQEEILKQLQYKIDIEMYKKVKEAEKKAYKKSHGKIKPLPAISGCTTYAESQKFTYRAIEPEWKFIIKDNQGRFQSSGKTLYYERLKKKQ